MNEWHLPKRRLLHGQLLHGRLGSSSRGAATPRLAQTALTAIMLLLLVNRVCLAIDVGTSEPYRAQRFDSWGTSLAWFANSLGNWSNQQAHEEVMDLLFDGPNNLGLNYARYNIGGGQNPQLFGNFRPGAAISGYVPYAPASIADESTWQWNWNSDAGQRKSLDSAIARGVTRVDAISYSAPYWMTNSQDTAGAIDGGSNLQTQYYDEYAHYQTEVIDHFQHDYGVHFNSFNPMNEAAASYWKAGGRQEGMHVSRGADQRLMYETVGQMLLDRGLETGLVVGDEFNAGGTRNSLDEFSPATFSYVRQINTHGYGNNSVGAMQALRNYANAQDAPLYNSEYGNNSTTGLDGGIALANRITDDVNVAGVNGWTYWQAVEPLSLSHSGWGLMWADYGINGSQYVVRKQYHVMRQFTSYIRPGAVILDTSDQKTVAAYNPGDDSTVLVVTNDQTGADVNVYDLLDKTPAYSRTIRTDDSGNYVSLGPGDLIGNQLTINSPGTAVTTAVVYHRQNLIQNAAFASGGAGWQTSGDAHYDATLDNTHDGSGAVVLESNSPTHAGGVWQEGIGNASIDLTGKAYEFSIDSLLQNDAAQFGAEAEIGLEFYGADGATLTHNDPSDFSERLKPAGQDSEYRVFRTNIVQAPAGTRFVRPVVRFDKVAPGAAGLIFLDNAYLQESRFVPRARTWNNDADGNWGDSTNWVDDATVANNNAIYFGPQITAPRTVNLDSNVSATGVTFDSQFGYQLVGAGSISIGNSAATAKIDVRSGNHSIQTAASLSGPAEIQVVGNARLTFAAGLALHGHSLRKTGPGQLRLQSGFDMGGGALQVEASRSPSILLGADSVLDGALQVRIAPGQQVDWGSLYTLAKLSSPGQTFNQVQLPELDKPWYAWEVGSGPSRALTAEVVNLADFHADDAIDGNDLIQWEKDFGANANSDANGDAATDGGDFLLWQRALGNTANANVPTLLVDPDAGNAQIANRTTAAFTIDGYTVSSASGSLLDSWNSLQDQGTTGWVETLPDSSRLSELNPTGAWLLAAGDSIDLDGLFNTDSGTQDLQFQFHDATLGTINGRVLFTDLPNSLNARTVPEPSSLLLMLLTATALLALFARCRNSEDNRSLDPAAAQLTQGFVGLL